MKHNKRLTALLAGMLAVSMLFTGCGGSNSGASDTGLIDGTYEGTGAGYGGNIKLALTVEGGKITKAEVLEHSETAGVSDPALEQIPAAIVEKQGIEGIEAVAGCTRGCSGSGQGRRSCQGSHCNHDRTGCNRCRRRYGWYDLCHHCS